MNEKNRKLLIFYLIIYIHEEKQKLFSYLNHHTIGSLGEKQNNMCCDQEHLSFAFLFYRKIKSCTIK